MTIKQNWRLQLRIFSIVLFIGLYSCNRTQQKKENNGDQPPNILFVISDDQGYPYASAYGCPFVQTPNFDRIAHEGLLCTNFFVDAPQCSPSRASILTGKHIWQIGPAGTHASIFPAGLPVYTDILKANGYQVGYTGKGWGPGSWQDGGRTTNPAGILYEDRTENYGKGRPQKRWTGDISSTNYAANFEMFLSKRDKNAPFCFWFGGREPHRPYTKGSGIKRGGKLSAVKVPPYLPDVNTVRSDFLDYAVEIEWFDQQVGKALDILNRAGELDNTLIIFIGDNGMPFPRAKAYALEAGVHTPMAIMWKNHIKNPGRTVDDLIAAVDIAPTLLEAAGIQEDIPKGQGKSLLNIFENGKSGVTDSTRKYVFFGRERHSDARWENLGYPARAVRTDHYLYIWNLKPQRYPAGAPKKITGDTLDWAYHDIDGSPTKTYMIVHRDDPALATDIEVPAANTHSANATENSQSIFNLAFGKFPEEMLYDIHKDPYCLNNLAGNSQYNAIKTHLSSVLKQKLKATHDPRMGQIPDIWESYRRYGPMRKFQRPDWADSIISKSQVINR